MIKLLSSALLLFSASASAQATFPVGIFGHEFTKTKNAPVWSIRPAGKGFNLLIHGDGTRKAAHIFTANERQSFWGEMAWDANSHLDSECIGGKTEIICYVPAKTRQSIPDLQSHESDFFHFDKAGGIMEIKKIDG